MARSREANHRGIPEFAGTPLDLYQKDKKIVVNDGEGNWVQANIEKNATINANGELEVEVTYTDRNGVTKTETKKLTEAHQAPDVIKYKVGDDIVDSQDNVTYKIDSIDISPDGTITYQVELTDNNGTPTVETHRGVSQEYVDLLKKTNELRKEARRIRGRIQRVIQSEQQALNDYYVTISNKVQEAYAALPEITELRNTATKDLESVRDSIQSLHAEAETAIRDLSVQIYRSETHLEIDPKKVEHAPTQAEIDDGEVTPKDNTSAHERKREIGKAQFERIKKLLNKERAIIRRRLTSDQKDQIQEELRIELGKNPGDNFSGNDKKLIKERIEERLVEPQLNAEKDRIITQLDQSPAGKLVKNEIDRIRKEQAKHEIDASRLNGNDYTDDEADVMNRELLMQVLEDWKNLPREPRTQEVEQTSDKEVFNFDEEFEQAGAAFESFLESLKDEDGNIPASGAARDAYDATVARLEEHRKEKDAIASKKAGKAAGKYGRNKTYGTINKLRTARVELINQMYRDLSAHRELATDKKRLEKVQELNSQVEQRESRIETIDIPQSLLVELLNGKKSELKTAIKELATKPPTEVKSSFIALFEAGNPPNQAMLDQLAEYGITNWDTFCKLWKEKLVDMVIPVMQEQLQASVKMHVTKELQGSAKGMLKQMKKNWKTILARTTIMGGLIAGAAVAAPAAIGAAGLTGLAAKVAAGVGGGVAVGAVRAGMAKVGKMSWIEKAKKAVGFKTGEQIQEELQTEEADTWLQDTLAAIDTNTNTDAGVERYAAIMSETLRATTAGEISVGDVTLKGDARVQYEQALAKMEVRNPEEAQKIELARMISALNRNGEQFEEKMKDKTDPAVITAIEKFMRARGGHDGMKTSMLVGGAVGGTLALNPELRAALGGAAGTYFGYKTAESWADSSEREQARETISSQLEEIRAAIDEAERGVRSSFTDAEKATHLALKKLLHGTAAPDQLVGLGFKLQTKSEDGTAVEQILIDAEIKSTIQAMVFEAERAGVMIESGDQVADMKKLLEQLKKTEDAVVQDEKKKGIFNKKNGYKLAGAVVGGLLGAGAALAGGALFSRYVEGGGDAPSGSTPEADATSAAQDQVAAAAASAEAASETAGTAADMAAEISAEDAAAQAANTVEQSATEVAADVDASPDTDATAADTPEVVPTGPSPEYLRISEIFADAEPINIGENGVNTFDEIYDTYLDNLSEADQHALAEVVASDTNITPEYDTEGNLENADRILRNWKWGSSMEQIAVRGADIPENVLQDQDFRDGVTALGFDPDNIPADARIPINGYDIDSGIYNIMLQDGNVASLQIGADGTPYIELASGTRDAVDIRPGFTMSEAGIDIVEPVDASPIPPDPESDAAQEAARRAAEHDPRDFNDNERTTMRERRLSRSGADTADFRADVGYDAVEAVDTNDNDRLSFRERRGANAGDLAANHPADVNNDGRISGPERRYFNRNPEAYGPQTGPLDQMARTITTDINATSAAQTVEAGALGVLDDVAAANGIDVPSRGTEVQTVGGYSFMADSADVPWLRADSVEPVSTLSGEVEPVSAATPDTSDVLADTTPSTPDTTAADTVGKTATVDTAGDVAGEYTETFAQIEQVDASLDDLFAEYNMSAEGRSYVSRIEATIEQQLDAFRDRLTFGTSTQIDDATLRHIDGLSAEEAETYILANALRNIDDLGLREDAIELLQLDHAPNSLSVAEGGSHMCVYQGADGTRPTILYDATHTFQNTSELPGDFGPYSMRQLATDGSSELGIFYRVLPDGTLDTWQLGDDVVDAPPKIQAFFRDNPDALASLQQ